MKVNVTIEHVLLVWCIIHTRAICESNPPSLLMLWSIVGTPARFTGSGGWSRSQSSEGLPSFNLSFYSKLPEEPLLLVSFVLEQISIIESSRL